jgi:hypothetical protein
MRAEIAYSKDNFSSKAVDELGHPVMFFQNQYDNESKKRPMRRFLYNH